jgi:hypothetical protein
MVDGRCPCFYPAREEDVEEWRQRLRVSADPGTRGRRVAVRCGCLSSPSRLRRTLVLDCQIDVANAGANLCACCTIFSTLKREGRNVAGTRDRRAAAGSSATANASYWLKVRAKRWGMGRRSVRQMLELMWIRETMHQQGIRSSQGQRLRRRRNAAMIMRVITTALTRRY